MNELIVTVDLDWACEPAIEETVDFLVNQGVNPTIFITHRSARVEASLHEIDVGLHPFFDQNSSHGSTISDVVKCVFGFPHNLPAFRSHRFGNCNLSKQAMFEAGMLISSNVCTDLEIISPFRDRFGFLEVPVFLEDGGYLWQQRPLEINPMLKEKILGPGKKVIIIHPMHFAINSPSFSYMCKIKQSMSRQNWIGMTKKTLHDLRWKGPGITDFIKNIIEVSPGVCPLRDLITTG